MKKQEISIRLTPEGESYAVSGTPEKKLLQALEKAGGKIAFTEAQKIENFHVAMNWAKKNGWISIESGFVKMLKKPISFPHDEALADIKNGRKANSKIIEELLARKLVEEERNTEAVRAAEQAKSFEISALTPELIKTGMWRNVKLKPYNVEAKGEIIYSGKKHVLTLYIEKVRKIFLDMGFTEASGPLVESSFWNFDALYQPQDHPARDMADTFYMKNPKETALPPKELVEKVKKTHENGWTTGSSGWGYEWKSEIAKRPVLRTHTTAVSARMLSKIKPPAKVFCIGRVFRNETIDYKHLAEFTQVEGIVVDENVTFRNLLGYLREFYVRMGFEKIRFRPSYFPYTEMSVDPEVYFEDRGEWMEMGGAGIFRPEVTNPLGINCPVLAWGLGLERLIMLRMGITDIRNFYYRNDLDLLRKVKIWL